MDRDDDRYWKYGIFYVNRDDPAVIVPKRRGPLGIGIGRTLNYAHPVSWVVTLAPIAAAVLGPLLTR